MIVFKKVILCLFLFVFYFVNSQTSTSLLNLDKVESNDYIDISLLEPLDKPMPYGYVDERDILWSKTVWEYIDLNQKINLPFYYPSDTMQVSTNRRSLFDTLLKGILRDEITEIYDDSHFNFKLSKNDVKQYIQIIDTTDAGIDKVNYNEPLTEDDIIKTNLSSEHIEGFKIKGLYYFDKRQGELKYRLLAIAPVSPDVHQIKHGDYSTNLEDMVELFWVFYPNARETIHKMKVFNNKNENYPISYDMLLTAKRFDSIIYKEENDYNNREVADYLHSNSITQLQESNRIKDKIRSFELDMWNY